MFTVEQQDFSDFPMRDGDAVSVGEVIDLYENRVSVRGAVWRPGDYQLDDTVRSVVSLVHKAQGLRQDEYFERGIIRRLKPDGTYQALPVDVPDRLRILHWKTGMSCIYLMPGNFMSRIM